MGRQEGSPVIDSTYQDKLAKSREVTELGRVRRDRNLWRGAALLVLAVSVPLAWGYKLQVDDYANNVRVAWVKLAPNGDSYAEFLDDGGRSDRYFDRARDASLTNYVNWRFRVVPQTIDTDYGNASAFLGPAEEDKFLRDFGAAKRANEATTCTACTRIDITVRALDHSVVKPAVTGDDGVYKTAAFVTTTERDQAGGVLGRRNEIITLDWTLRPPAEIGKDLDQLAVNPLGIEIISQSVREDKS